MRPRAPLFSVITLAAVTFGCAGHGTTRLAQQAEVSGDWDRAVVHYLEAVRENPDSLRLKAALMRAKIEASLVHFKKGRQFHAAGYMERALLELRQAVELDPTNQFAEVELDKVREEIRDREENRSDDSIDDMKEKTRGMRALPPTLNPKSEEPITLTFPEPANVKDIYRALGKAFSINVLFDPKLRDQKIAIELVDVTPQNGFEIVMRTVGHFYKILDEHSVIIADDTPQNRRVYEDQVIQTFFLSNADVKDVMTMVRSLIGAKNVAANEQLNAIVLRDSADKVKVAEQIILANDKAKAEVVVDVELLQIDTTKLRELGMALSQNQITTTLDTGSEDALRLSDLEFLNQNNWALTIPSFLFNFIKTNGDAQTLAQPKLRITEGEKASLVIGDRVPIPTTTFNTQNAGANTGIIPVTSFQYQEVGIKIEIEPRVHHNEEVTLTLTVEVSDIASFVQGSGGQQQPVIGTRKIESNIRLRDGETNFLAGLIRTVERQDESGIPGLSDIPLIGRLFRNTRSEGSRSDIVLTLTPHIIRRADITESDLRPIWVGTEQNITFRGGSPQVESPNETGPFDEDDARSRIQERLRERLRSLPPGLQESEGEEKEPVDEQPAGIDLGGSLGGG